MTTIGRMDLSTSLSGSKEFRIVKRGYDPDEVNSFLDQIALGVGELKRKLAEAEDRVVAAEASATAAAEAPEPTAAAPEPAATAEADEIHRALILAQRAADEEVRKATEEGESLVADARRRADEMRAEIEEEIAHRRAEGRADLLGEIDELERVRDALANDVVVLERHVDEQREVVQAAIGELQSLLDHPEAFRIAAASGVSTVVPPLDAPAPPAEPIAEDPPAPEPAPEAPAAEPVTPPALEKEPASEAVAPPVPETPSPETAAPAPTPPPPPPVDHTAQVASPPAPPAPQAELFSGPPGGDEDDRDVGPPTEAVAAIGDRSDADEDAFLAELRKAMLDDEPLGPRDTNVAPMPLDDDAAGGRGRSRFGRRR